MFLYAGTSLNVKIIDALGYDLIWAILSAASTWSITIGIGGKGSWVLFPHSSS